MVGFTDQESLQDCWLVTHRLDIAVNVSCLCPVPPERRGGDGRGGGGGGGQGGAAGGDLPGLGQPRQPRGGVPAGAQAGGPGAQGGGPGVQGGGQGVQGGGPGVQPRQLPQGEQQHRTRLSSVPAAAAGDVRFVLNLHLYKYRLCIQYMYLHLLFYFYINLLKEREKSKTTLLNLK